MPDTPEWSHKRFHGEANGAIEALCRRCPELVEGTRTIHKTLTATVTC